NERRPEAQHARAREGLRDRLRVPVGRALPVPGGHLGARRHRPRGRHPRPGHQLARGHRAARGGGHAGGVRPLLELLPQDPLRHPRGPRERDRAQGADRASPVGQLLRHPAEGAALQVPAAGAGAVGGGLEDGRRRLAAERAGRLGTAASLMRSVKHLVIGAGVHGLSTAWHLAERGEEVLVVDKAGVAAGASGIACGVVRNNYFQPAMSELMAACVEIWESDPETLHYHGSGYVALGDGEQEADLTTVAERQERIGYESELIVGEDEVDAHMRAMFPDWRAPGLSVCLHEHRGGFAFNKESIHGLATKALHAGAEIDEGIEVTGFELDHSGAVTRVRTSEGPIAVEQVIVAVGPWVANVWEMLRLPRRLEIHSPDGSVATDQEMWTYW